MLYTIVATSYSIWVIIVYKNIIITSLRPKLVYLQNVQVQTKKAQQTKMLYKNVHTRWRKRAV